MPKKKSGVDLDLIKEGDRVQIPVALLEFTVGGNTLWVHSPKGATVLRVKFPLGIRIAQCGPGQPCSHMDVTIGKDQVREIPPTVCLTDDVEV